MINLLFTFVNTYFHVIVLSALRFYSFPIFIVYNDGMSVLYNCL